MKKEHGLILFGNRVRQLIDILGLEKQTHLNCIYMNREYKYVQATELRNIANIRKHRLSKEDIKLIRTLYEITGDLETSLFHLFKD